MPMPQPGIVGVPLFKGANATEFLNHFDDLCKEYLVADQDKLAKLLQYCSRNIRNSIRSLKEWEDKDYPALWEAILQEYKDYDSYQWTYSLQFLKKYKSIICTKKDDVLQYCHHFNMIAKALMCKDILSVYTMGVWFIHGLPLSIAAKVMWKYDIDTEDPRTVS